MTPEDRKELAIQKAEHVLNQIDRKWTFIKDEKFNPVALALQMSDSSSIGLDYNVFKRYHQALNASLEDIINEYYTSFNTSILSFSGLHDRINSASTTIGQTRSDLITVKQLLTEERGSVEQLYTKSKQAEETLSIIDKIIEVRNLPQEVRQLVEEKKFTEASKKLAQGLQFVSNPEFRPIKTLYVLEQKLNGEKENAVKVIIEELHNHVYLKSPYSERKFTLEEGSDDDEEAIKKIRVGAYAKKKDAKTPESDSFSYVGQLLECLSTLNMGTVVTATVVERAPKEISELVDRIITEVEDRAQNLIDQATWQSPDSLEEAASEALDDFFRVLFSGFESVLDYHFHISRMIEKINAEASGPPGSDPAQVNSVKPYDVGLIWAAMKQEIAVLLKNYLIPAGNALASGTAGADKDGRPQHTLFEISLDTESHEIAVQLYDDILTKMGNLDLVDGAKSLAPEASQAPVSQYLDKVKSHKLLADPSIWHSPVIFNASVRFVDHINSTMFGSEDERDSGIFLHEFFFRTYLPHVEEVAAQKFQQMVTAPDAFIPDSTHYDVTLFRSATQLIPMIRNFSELLSSLSLLKNDTFDITLDLSRKYYESCFGLFNATLTGPNGRKYTSAKWAENEDLVQLLDMVMSLTSMKGWVDFSTHADREIRLEEALKTDRSLYSGEMISDPKKLILLAALQQTLKWFMAELRSIEADRVKRLGDDSTKIESTIAKAQRKILDEIIDKYNALSIQCLVVLRIELRISCIYHLDLATREGEYNIGRSEIEPDRYIQILNSKLALYQEKMYIILSDDELNFVFGGISILMAHMLIVNTRHIREFNSYGAEKMIRNVLSLQQNLTNIALSGESGLDRARKFYELYLFGVDGILRHIANEGPNFSFDEYKVLIDFTYQHMLAQPSTEVGAAIDEVGESGVASLPPYESTISTLKQLFNVA